LFSGMGGLGSALLGNLADHTSITYVYNLCAFTFDWDHCFLLPNLKEIELLYSNLFCLFFF
jgi:FSR family fosmidomycin resistance protein-like MFS transporter